MSVFDTTVLRANLLNSNPASPAYFEMGFLGLPRIFWAEELQPYLQDTLKKRSIRQQRWVDNFADYRFRCMGTDLPARQLETQPRQYAGPMRLIPYGMVYSNLNVNLIEGRNLRMRELFDIWHELCFIGPSEDMHHVPMYYDDIICDMEIKVFAKNGDLVRRYILKDCFPIAVNPSQLSWDAHDQVMVVPVEISYHQFIAESSWNNAGQKGNDNLLNI